jgi:hypothetical protein
MERVFTTLWEHWMAPYRGMIWREAGVGGRWVTSVSVPRKGREVFTEYLCFGQV